jgi:hypothetical protein
MGKSNMGYLLLLECNTGARILIKAFRWPAVPKGHNETINEK